MDRKFTQEELLYSLECFFGWYKDAIKPLVNEQQAYTQIRELILDSDLATWMDRGHEQDLEITKLRDEFSKLMEERKEEQ